MALFEVVAKLDVTIRLTETQWEHIKVKHPELEDELSKIKDALKEPDFVCYSSKDDNYQYYKYFERTPVTKKHLLVIIKRLNSEGFVITAFFLRKVRKEKEVVYGEENFDKL